MVEKESISLLENVIFLKKTKLFSSIQTSELRAVAAIAEELTFKSGDVIVQENDVGDSLFIIKNGIVEVIKEVDGKKSVRLAQLSSGECFGEMALFDAELRSASVCAKKTCTLLCIKSDDINDLMLDYPTIAIEFLRLFVKRLRKADKSIEILSSNKKK